MDYQIKSEMTKQHKKYLLELKKAYDKSHESLKEQEGKCKKVVDDLVEEIQKKVGKSNKLSKEISEKELLIEDLKAENNTLEQRFNENSRKLARQELNNEEKIEHFERERKDIVKKRKEAAEMLIESEKKLESLKEAGKEIERSNERALERVKGIREDNKRHETKLLEGFVGLKEQQHKFQKEKKAHEEENAAFKAAVTKITLDKKELAVKEKTMIDRTAGQLKRDNEHKEEGKKLQDRHIEQELKQVNLDEQERRINSLIEIHKFKK